MARRSDKMRLPNVLNVSATYDAIKAVQVEAKTARMNAGTMHSTGIGYNCGVVRIVSIPTSCPESAHVGAACLLGWHSAAVMAWVCYHWRSKLQCIRGEVADGQAMSI